MGEAASNVERAIIAHWGERCPDYAGDCDCCLAWRQFDQMRIAGLKEAAELIEARHKAHVARNSVAYELESEACASLIRARISSLSPSETENDNG